MQDTAKLNASLGTTEVLWNLTDLYSGTDEKLANLYTGNIQKERTFMITWDGKDPYKKETYHGEYNIRWSINEGYREFPIVIN